MARRESVLHVVGAPLTAVTLLLAACGSDAAPTALVPTTVAPIETTAAPASVADRFQTPTDFSLPPPEPGAGAAAGSGCGLEQPVGDVLDDGVWLIRIVGRADQQLTVDLACGFQDPGNDQCTVFFSDWCARDSTQRLRDAGTDADIRVLVVDAAGTALVDGQLAGLGDSYTWVAVNRGLITQATQQRP